MNESIALAQKLKAAMLDKGVKPAELAREFGVKAPSVYDWLEFGRIAKKHIPKLAEYFGKPVGWWPGEDEEELLEDNERQLLAMFRDLKQDAKDKLLQEATWLRNQDANTQPAALIPKTAKRAD